MNDDELIAALREQRSKVHMTTPVEQIASRGRAVRARRRIPGVAGALAVAAGAALAVTALLPASQPVSRPPTAELAAWTVVKLADGNISVTIRELRDPAGLQRRLRADGVPASVTFSDQLNPSCRPYPGGTLRPYHAISPLLKRVFPRSYQEPPADGGIVIHPSALPSDAGVQLAAGFSSTPEGVNGVAAPSLVYAGPQCTGS